MDFFFEIHISEPPSNVIFLVWTRMLYHDTVSKQLADLYDTTSKT